MFLSLDRFSSQSDSTLGLLRVNGQFACFILEDEYRAIKVPGETRIPAGRYPLKLRTHGGFHNRYINKYGTNFHKGMLEICEVPGFTDILIHTGNTDDHTAGCLLVGDTCTQNVTKEGFVGSSVDAYQRVYPPIADALLNGEEVILHIEGD